MTVIRKKVVSKKFKISEPVFYFRCHFQACVSGKLTEYGKYWEINESIIDVDLFIGFVENNKKNMEYSYFFSPFNMNPSFRRK